MRIATLSIILGVIALAGCEDPYQPTPRPDYTIRVMPTPNGNLVAIPPSCPSWTTATTDPYDNKQLPQLGCATARNLAMMVEQPQDLVKGRDLGGSSGVTAVGSVLRYNYGQTRGLIWTGADPNQVSNTTASTPNPAVNGEVIQPGSSASSSSSSSSGSTPSTPAAPGP